MWVLDQNLGPLEEYQCRAMSLQLSCEVLFSARQKAYDLYDLFHLIVKSRISSHCGYYHPILQGLKSGGRSNKNVGNHSVSD